jgi:hypothetical protein
VESGTGSIELLHRQLVAQASELKEAKRLHRLDLFPDLVCLPFSYISKDNPPSFQLFCIAVKFLLTLKKEYKLKYLKMKCLGKYLDLRSGK